jgi:hypothetical protein
VFTSCSLSERSIIHASDHFGLVLTRDEKHLSEEEERDSWPKPLSLRP